MNVQRTAEYYLSTVGISKRICIQYVTVDSLPRQMPNSVQMYHTFCLASHPHVAFVFAFRCKPGFRPSCHSRQKCRGKTTPMFLYNVFFGAYRTVWHGRCMMGLSSHNRVHSHKWTINDQKLVEDYYLEILN